MEADKLETMKLVKNVNIPPPHAPPPPTMRMATRDSNRMKRFSAYGVIDTSAARAGNEEALIAAALAEQAARDADLARTLMETSTVVLSERDTAIAEAVVEKTKLDSPVPSAKVTPKLKDLKVVITESPPVTIAAKASGSTAAKTPVFKSSVAAATPTPENKRPRRSVGSRTTPSVSPLKPPAAPPTPKTPSSTNRKRQSRPASPPPAVETKRKSTGTSGKQQAAAAPAPPPVEPEAAPASPPPVTNNVDTAVDPQSLSSIGRVSLFACVLPLLLLIVCAPIFIVKTH